MKYTGKPGRTRLSTDHWGKQVEQTRHGSWVSHCACGWQTNPRYEPSSAQIALYQHIRNAL